ncbi:MAG: phosphatidylglycerophosphatase A [Tissierellia bacterium]|nr:phosphatidylglycerophosphatase A [Tissierellia bacterium]
MGNLSQKYKYSMEELTKETILELKERQVELTDIAEIVYELQEAYYDNLTLEMCLDSVEAVLQKREVVHAVLTGIEIDLAAERGLLQEPLLSIIKSDEGLYGIDEILPLSIVNLYGSIGLTNFGYLDKKKSGIIDKLDKAKNGTVNTFLDDIVAAIAAAAAARLAHRRV